MIKDIEIDEIRTPGYTCLISIKIDKNNLTSLRNNSLLFNYNDYWYLIHWNSIYKDKYKDGKFTFSCNLNDVNFLNKNELRTIRLKQLEL